MGCKTARFIGRLDLESNALKKLGRIVAGPMALAAYAAVVFEEYVWEKAKVAMESMGRLPAVAWAESALRKAPPWAAMLCFFIPGLSVVPFKLAAFALISHGHAFAGASLFVAAKTVGAALVGRVWKLTEPALRSVPFIDRNVDRLLAAKDAVKHWASSLWSVRYAKIALKKAARTARIVSDRIAGIRDASNEVGPEQPTPRAQLGSEVLAETALSSQARLQSSSEAKGLSNGHALTISGAKPDIGERMSEQAEPIGGFGLLSVRSKRVDRERERAAIIPGESDAKPKAHKP